MFRKTFIRLILVTAVATTTLLVFAASKTVQNASNVNKESCENTKDCEPTSKKSGYMILESFGRALMSAPSY